MTGKLFLQIFCGVLVGNCSAGVTFINGSLTGLNLYSTPFSKFIGTQFHDHINPIVGQLRVFEDDPCDMDKVDKDHIGGTIVMVKHTGPCSAEIVNDNFIRNGAIAIIVFSPWPPSITLNFKDTCSSCLAHRSDIPFMVLQDSNEMVDAVRSDPSTAVSLYPDYNIWETAFSSWDYQLFIRWLPVSIYCQASVTAAIFIHGHYTLICNRYRNTILPKHRNWNRFMWFLWSRMGYPHLTLFIAMCHTALLASILGIGGHFSTSHLSARVMLFFATQNSGMEFAISIFSSAFWNRKLSEVTRNGRFSMIIRIFRGDYKIFAVIVCFLTMALELVVSVMYAAYFEKVYPMFDEINGIMFLTIEIILGIQFLWGAILFQIECRRITKEVRLTFSPLRQRLDRLLHRWSYCAIGVGITMLTQSAGLFVMTTPEFTTLTGWTIAWSITCLTGGVKVTFLVHIFRPKKDDQQGTAVCVQAQQLL